MTEETQEPSSAEEAPSQEEALRQIEETEKHLRDKVVPIAKVEKAAREDRLSFERAADELARARQTLFPIRNNLWPPGTSDHLIGLALSAVGSAETVAKRYGEIFALQQQDRTAAAAMILTATTVNTMSVSAYVSARTNDPTLDAIPPGAHFVPIYVPQAATPEQKELKTKLAMLAPPLADKLEGAWEALASNNPDRLGQAATSMQELLDQVLHHFADGPKRKQKDGRVKKAPWWKPDPKSRSGVTRAHRVRFVVQGYAEKVAVETETNIQSLIKDAAALASIQDLKHRHGPLKEGAGIVARRLLADLEAFLLLLLQLHRPEFHHPQA